MEKKPRVRGLDFLRGLAVLNMIAYHAMYDMVYFFAIINAPWYGGTAGYLWQQSICWGFILASGASLNYGKKTLRHALVLFGCAGLLSFVTALAGASMFVAFGILHMLACSLLVFALAKPLIKKMPNKLGAAIFFGLFAVFKSLPQGYLGFLDFGIVKMPKWLYSTKFLFALGLPSAGFYSSDYFPLVPWFFLFLAGFYAFGTVKQKALLKPAGKNPLEWAGRHSLIIYMLHQPIIYGLLWLC